MLIGQRRANQADNHAFWSSPASLSPDQLLERFATGNPRQRRSLIKTVEARIGDLEGLGDGLLAPFDRSGDDWAAGWLLQVLHRHRPERVSDLLGRCPGGWFRVESAVGIDYCDLQQNLRENFCSRPHHKCRPQAVAGSMLNGVGTCTSAKCLDVGGGLTAIDRLWTAYSQGRFGFTSQARLLQALGGRYDLLWPRIGWKCDGVWTRYPGAFTWSLEAPEGHMPLVNQLRGVRLMDALLNHPALQQRR